MKDILIMILGGGNLLLFIEFLISRYDKKKEQEKGDLRDEMLTIKRDGIRTQLLLLILLKPNETAEILKVAECYFEALEGNWYMTSIFNKWLESNDVAKPEWFDSKKGE